MEVVLKAFDTVKHLPEGEVQPLENLLTISDRNFGPFFAYLEIVFSCKICKCHFPLNRLYKNQRCSDSDI